LPYLLGIDQGTTLTTAVVLDERGSLLAGRSAPLPVSFPRPGWVEQDPWRILADVREVAGPLAAEYPPAAVGFDNQGETFLLWERASGRPLTPAIGWQDKRGLEVCRQLAPEVDPEWLRRKTGLLLDTYFCAPKLRAVLQADAGLADAARAGRALFGTLDSWVLWQLSGGQLHVTDPSTASRTLLFDINRLDWDRELLALFDVPRACLPEVRPSAGYAGDVDLGVGQPLPLHGLLVDQQAALFGQACFASGLMKCTFGTGAFLLMNIGPIPRPSAHGLLTTVAWQLAGGPTYALDGGIFVAGAVVQWLAEGLGLLPGPAQSSQAAAASTDREIVFVPALAGLGAPHWLPEARGAIFGLSRATVLADLVRAALDGIACRVGEVAEAMAEDAGQALSVLRADGGPSANPYLMQALADVLGSPVQVAAAREASACGVASLAGHAALGTSLDELAARWQPAETYTPRIDADERAARKARWQRALAAVRQYHDSSSTSQC
jgi:glycerol kinase